jgi:hypothetical protein
VGMRLKHCCQTCGVLGAQEYGVSIANWPRVELLSTPAIQGSTNLLQTAQDDIRTSAVGTI